MNLRSGWVKIGLAALVAIILLTVGALLLETNPPVKREPVWDSPQTRALAQRACFDCHSNETDWNIFTKMPVGSWLAVFDTVRGRRELNFSEWTPGGRRASEAGQQISRGEMPPALYTLIHPNAVLTAAEKQQLITGLKNSLK